MFSEDDTASDEISFDYVPKRQRTHQQQQSHRPTVYELERDAKVAQVLAQQRSQAVSQAHASDTVSDSAAGPAASSTHPQLPQDEPYSERNEATSARMCDNDAPQQQQERRYERRTTTMTTSGRARFASSRPPFHSLTPQEQQRQRTYHRNMYVMRNALREVDPETRELMQLRYNPADEQRGGRGASGGRGGMVSCYRNGGRGERGRGMHRNSNYGELPGRGRGRGSRGGYKRPRY